jgi:hypothetical protein
MKRNWKLNPLIKSFGISKHLQIHILLDAKMEDETDGDLFYWGLKQSVYNRF